MVSRDLANEKREKLKLANLLTLLDARNPSVCSISTLLESNDSWNDRQQVIIRISQKKKIITNFFKRKNEKWS